MKSTKNGENFYEEPQEDKTNEEEHEPKEKNMKIFHKLNVNDNTNIVSTPHEEEFSNQNYEAIEDHETTLYKYIHKCVNVLNIVFEYVIFML